MKESLNTIPAVLKAVSVLEYLGAQKPGVGVTQAQLCGYLEISASSCYRILQSLQHSNWIRRSGNGNYYIANGIFRATKSLLDQNIRFEKYQPILDRLSQVSGVACKLSVRCGYEQVTVLRGESPQEISVSGKVGAHFSLIEGSVGAALLMNDSAEELDDVIRFCHDNLEERDEPIIILERIAKVKKYGYVVTHIDENRWNICAMSMPIKDSQNEVVAAITLLGWESDFSDEGIKKLKDILLDRVNYIQKSLENF